MRTIKNLLTLLLILSTYFSCMGMKPMLTGKTSFASNNPPIINDCNGGEGNCLCSVEVNNIVDGRPSNRALLESFSGGSALNVLTGAGSENIPVTCNAGLYLLNSNGARNWFVEYFNLQTSGTVPFGGSELFSSAYFQQTVAYILVVLNHAIQRGDVDVELAASQWLKKYYSFLTLAASSSKPNTYSHTQRQGLISGLSTGSGYGVSIVGTRNYPTQARGTGAHYLFLSIALNNRSRDYNWSVNQSPGVTGGLRAFLVKTGYHIDGNGKVNLNQKPLTHREAGIDDSTSIMLSEFINSNGNVHVSSVMNNIRNTRLFCEITFLRTTGGIITWFGNSTQNTPTCTLAKGGSYNAAAYTFGSAEGQILVRVDPDNNPSMGETWRNSQRICANAGNMPTECIDIPGGNVVYEISHGFSGPICKAGNCSGGGTQPTPQPTPTPTQPTPTPGQIPPGPAIPPPDVAPNCATNALCLLNGRFKIQASFQNQFTNTSGVASRITYSDSSGFLHFGDATNVELIIKVLDYGDHVKFFYGQLTNLKFNIKVLDTQSGTVKYYQNTAGDCGALDTRAFASFGSFKFQDIASVKTLERAPTSQACTPTQNTLCLQNGRIKVTATWRNHYNSNTGNALVKPLSPATGGISYSDPANLELLVKALDFGNHFLIMYGTLSDLEYTMTVTDTVTGRTKDFFNRGGNYCGGMDQTTFTK